MYFSEFKVFGNYEKNKLLFECFNKKNCPHAWIIYGDKGLGKFFSVNNLIHLYLKKHPSANFFVLNTPGNPANIENIRDIIGHLCLTNNSGIFDKTFVVIDDADEMSFNAHNALLKTLEEPPKNTLLILISHRINKLPKTIISRCSLVKFERLSFSEIKDYINNTFETSPSNLTEIIRSTNGFPKYINLFKSEIINEINNITKMLIENDQFNYQLFQKLMKLVEKDYDKYFYIIITLIFNSVKTKIIKLSDENIDEKNKNLNFLEDMKFFFSENMIIDNKKKLHYVFHEYYNLCKAK